MNPHPQETRNHAKVFNTNTRSPILLYGGMILRLSNTPSWLKYMDLKAGQAQDLSEVSGFQSEKETFSAKRTKINRKKRYLHYNYKIFFF